MSITVFKSLEKQTNLKHLGQIIRIKLDTQFLDKVQNCDYNYPKNIFGDDSSIKLGCKISCFF